MEEITCKHEIIFNLQIAGIFLHSREYPLKVMKVGLIIIQTNFSECRNIPTIYSLFNHHFFFQTAENADRL